VGPDLPLDTSRAGTLQAAMFPQLGFVCSLLLRVKASPIAPLPRPCASGPSSRHAHPERQGHVCHSGEGALDDMQKMHRGCTSALRRVCRPGSVDLPGCHGTTRRPLAPNLSNYMVHKDFSMRPLRGSLAFTHMSACPHVSDLVSAAVCTFFLVWQPALSLPRPLLGLSQNQTRSIISVIESVLLGLPCERDQSTIIRSSPSSPHRQHTVHGSPTCAFRTMFCGTRRVDPTSSRVTQDTNNNTNAHTYLPEILLTKYQEPLVFMYGIP
jgi:hypothetical protein